MGLNKTGAFARLLMCAVTGLAAEAEERAADRGKTQIDFLVSVSKRISGTVPPQITFDNLPDSHAVVAALRRPRCLLATFGKFAPYAPTRLRTTKYLGYWVIAARQLEGDRVQALFGVSNARTRMVALLDPF